LDCATVADGLPAYGGKLFEEEVIAYSTIDSVPEAGGA